MPYTQPVMSELTQQRVFGGARGISSPSINTLPANYDRLVANFVKHVDRSGGPNACWPWTGTIQTQGYGCLGYLCADGKSRRFLAHRIARMLATGQAILPEIQVMHRCDNRPCCNPRHLFEGSQSDNMQDAVRKGRASVGPLNGMWKPELHR